MIGRILKTMRHKSNITQDSLSKTIFIGRSTLSDYEREKTDINFDNMEKFAKACGYEIRFVNINDGTYLSSKNIDREEI
jgi:transcriptional regulator with XRE-family HTH domain